MHVCGIICEYNPLHNGHAYQIREARNQGADAIVAVMSGNFVQRGDAAILDKHCRAQLALASGVDLVVELPVLWSLAPAEQFAAAGVALLEGLQLVDTLSFGCECSDLPRLYAAADACTKSRQDPALSELLRSGLSYPAAIAQLVARYAGADTAALLQQPNNTLAIAYLEAIRTQQSRMQPLPVQRIGAAHDSLQAVTDDSDSDSAAFASASRIRAAVAAGEPVAALVPEATAAALEEAAAAGSLARIERLERVLLYRLRMLQSPEELEPLAEVGGQGLARRIFQARHAASVPELLTALKTRRYPMARLRRILLHLLLGITQSDIQQLPPYGRILALNETGRLLLRASKKQRTLPYLESLRRLSDTGAFAARCAACEAQAADLYQLTQERIGTGGSDFRRKITLTEPKEESISWN